MKPFHDYELSSILSNQKAKAMQRIDSMSNAEIMANDLEILAENIYQEFYIEPVLVFDEDYSKRHIKQGKIRKLADFFDRYDFDSRYVEVDGIIASFVYPYCGDIELFSTYASTRSLSGYPDITLNDQSFTVKIEKTLREMEQPNAKEELIREVERNVNKIKSGLSYANADVKQFNDDLKPSATKALMTKRKKVESFYSIATMLEIPVEKKEHKVLPISIKRYIQPITHSYEADNYYGISDKDYYGILDTINHTISTYERTPDSYKAMHEEDLRNTLLGALNATYRGLATGEAFRHKGKTDICIECENRAAFVAECKMWTGPKEVSNAVNQLDSYLTWRDHKTALIYFVRRKDFLKVLELARSTLSSIENIKSVLDVDKNIFDCQLISKSTPGQIIKMRVMLYNLYTD